MMVTLLPLLSGCAPAQVTLSGVAFEFAGQGAPVADATVWIDEDPELCTVTDGDGFWSLSVLDGEPATPMVRHTDFREMAVETFTPAGEDLDHVNLQLIAPAFVELYGLLLGIAEDPLACQVASTVNTSEIFGLSLDEFYAYGPHGVEGAVVSVEPAAGELLYMAENGVPERELDATTSDGGVVLPNLAPGSYTLRAERDEAAFAAVSISCVAGRFINASPPRGLREL